MLIYPFLFYQGRAARTSHIPQRASLSSVQQYNIVQNNMKTYMGAKSVSQEKMRNQACDRCGGTRTSPIAPRASSSVQQANKIRPKLQNMKTGGREI
jgi:hypothetical protein